MTHSLIPAYLRARDSNYPQERPVKSRLSSHELFRIAHALTQSPKAVWGQRPVKSSSPEFTHMFIPFHAKDLPKL